MHAQLGQKQMQQPGGQDNSRHAGAGITGVKKAFNRSREHKLGEIHPTVPAAQAVKPSLLSSFKSHNLQNISLLWQGLDRS